MDQSDVASSPVPSTTVLDTALYDLTDRCYTAFERLVEAGGGPEPSSDESSSATPHDLAGLKNSFSFWVDYTGALAPVGASLDDRLVGYEEVKEMVVELLEMVERNIYQLQCIAAEPLLERSWWDQSLLSISAALDRLNFLASAIRKASAKKGFGGEVLLNLATDEEILFKNTAIAYVKWKFQRRERVSESISVLPLRLDGSWC